MARTDLPYRYHRRKSETLPFVLSLLLILIVATGAGLAAYALKPQRTLHHVRALHLAKVVQL